MQFSRSVKTRKVKIVFILAIFFQTYITALDGQEKPNVLFIGIDDLNDYVGCMNGSIHAITPNIDALASEGILFTNAHCQAPICGPSRASIMTGMYPSSSGNYLQLGDRDIKKGSDKAAQATFMPDYFETQGYKTMAVGKIFHRGDDAQVFDEYGGKFDWFGPKPPKRLKYDPSKLSNKVGNTQTDWGPYPGHDSLMTDYKSAEWAIKKLAQDHDKPFFMALGFVRPHVPWHVPQKWFDKISIDKISVPPYNSEDYDDIPNFGQKVAEAPMMPTTEELIASGEWKNALHAYLACIAFVDHQVGKVLKALKESKFSNNTIIVLWSDHGYHLGEKNRFAKQALWERDTRTVLIIKDSNRTVGQKCHASVQLLDIYPSLVDLCNLSPLGTLEGNSLLPLIENPDLFWNKPALTFYGVGNISIRNERYRLIQYEDRSQELYDLYLDPNEWENIAQQSNYQSIIKELKQHIPQKWAKLSAYSTYNFNPYFIEKSKGLLNE